MAAPAQIAVVGASTAAGNAILERLARTEAHVTAVDVVGPDMAPGQVEVKLMDARDRLLPLALEGTDVLVHAAFCDDLAASPDVLYGVNVGGTRNVLDAASKAGVDHLVVLSSTTAYGAHPDNPVPLSERAPLRANPGFAYGYQRQLVEEMVAEWAQAHPATTVTVLRSAPLLAPGIDTAIARLLHGPRLALPAGGTPLWQFLHPEDLAEAVALAVEDPRGGTLNVAADGWLTTAEIATAVGTRVAELGQTTMAQALRLAAQAGMGTAPPEVLPYLSHPWVVDVSALRERGWRPQRSNREVVSTFAESVAGQVALGALTVPRRSLRQAVLGLAALIALAGWRGLRGRRSTA